MHGAIVAAAILAALLALGCGGDTAPQPQPVAAQSEQAQEAQQPAGEPPSGDQSADQSASQSSAQSAQQASAQQRSGQTVQQSEPPAAAQAGSAAQAEPQRSAAQGEQAQEARQSAASSPSGDQSADQSASQSSAQASQQTAAQQRSAQADQQSEPSAAAQAGSAAQAEPQRSAAQAEQAQEAQQSAAGSPSGDQSAAQSANQSAAQAVQEAEPQPAETREAPPQPVFIPAFDGRRFEQPIELLAWPHGGLLVAEQRGSLTIYGEDGSQRGLLDLSAQVRFGGEQGLLSAALDPDFAQQPFLYVWYSPRSGGVTRLSRFPIAAGVADRDAELIILEVVQPYSNHNGGAIRFGPDGMLYLGIGDGGAANDPHGHGQNRATLLGTIIRIDVRGASAALPYRIPADNPFLGVGGVRPEIFAWGLRNPWRMAFDPATGVLWVGDVGQDRVEEVTIAAAGSNQGWNVFEGDECFGDPQDCAALEHSPPLAVYRHDLVGCASVTGGVVYRGAELPWLTGAYLFSDYCLGRVWALEPDGGGWTMRELAQLNARIVSFGVDRAGEVYLLAINGPILRLSSAE